MSLGVWSGSNVAGRLGEGLIGQSREVGATSHGRRWRPGLVTASDAAILPLTSTGHPGKVRPIG